MTKAAIMMVGIVLVVVLARGFVRADEQGKKVKKELFAVITLQGHPCGGGHQFYATR